jgi:membrane protease YdiL (CAAX protease family)
MSTGYQMDQTFAVWRILVGAVIIVAIYGLGLFGVGFFLNGMAGIDLTQSSQTTLILFLASFIPIWLGTGAVTRVLFGFSLPHLYGRSGKIRWSDFPRGVCLYICDRASAGTAGICDDLGHGDTPIHAQRCDFDNGLAVLFAALGRPVFLQIGAEELFFRGYLLRLIYSRKARLFWAVYVPSFLFGLAHLDPITYGFNSVLYVLNTTVTGMILCFITLWRGNIAMAMGIHFAVNIFAILIIGQGDTPIGSGAALWLSTIAPKSATLGLSMILITFVEIVLYSIWARRRYGALIPSEAR